MTEFTEGDGGGDPAGAEGTLPSIQTLIDTGMAWKLEGHVGRQCMAAIEAGEAILGPKPLRDYYGNLVPAWWMVEAGTKGSPEFAGQERPEEPSDEDKQAAREAVGLVKALPAYRCCICTTTPVDEPGDICPTCAPITEQPGWDTTD